MNESQPLEQNTDPKTDLKTPGAASRIITQVAPFLLPVLFFHSAIFALISPLPLFILTLRSPIWMSALALALNAVLLYFSATPTQVGMAFFFWLSVGVLFPYLIRKSGKVRLSLLLSYLYLDAILVLTFALLAKQASMGLVEYLRADISIGMDHLLAIPDSPVKAIVDEQGKAGLFRQFMTELPSGVLIGILVSFWINLLFASQIVRGFLSPKFWATYRNPEWLVWPTLGFGALFAFSEHAPYFIGLNVFKVILVFYAFQGLSVMSHLLNHFKIFGFGRALLFCFALLVALPLVLSLGFFDLWFDFRRKFGQS